MYSKSLILPKQLDSVNANVVPKMMPQVKDICTTLPDGHYATRDTLQMLTCKDRKSIITDCPKDTIYVRGSNCTNSSKVTEGESNINEWISSQFYNDPSGIFHFFALTPLEILAFSSNFDIPPWNSINILNRGVSILILRFIFRLNHSRISLKTNIRYKISGYPAISKFSVLLLHSISTNQRR